MSTIKSSAENLTLNADGANNDIKFQSNGSEVASIDQAGVLTAGGGTLTGTLNTVGITNTTGASDMATFVTTSGNREIIIKSTAATGNNTIGGIRWQAKDSADNNTTFGGIATTVTDNTNGSEDGTLIFQTNGAGTFAERLRIQSAGGISFNGDTAAANALNDYEEGSWTPQLTGANNLSHRQGRYTKIGKQVHLEGEFRCTSYSNSGSTEVTITGAPFAVGNYSNYNVTGSIQPVNGFNQANDWGFTLYAGANSTEWNIVGQQQSTGVNYDYLHRSEMGSGIVEVFFIMHYSVS